MALLTRAAFFDAQDLKHEDVEVPQLGGSVRIRMMTGAERDEFREHMATFENGVPVSTMSAALLVQTCIDESGARMFSMEEIDQLREKSAVALDTMAKVAMRLNGLGNAAVADAAKNSESGQSGDSGSASPESSAKA